MAVSKDSLRGFAVTIATLWGFALVFAVAADQHFDGVLSRDIAAGAPPNMLDFQSGEIFVEAAVFTLLLGLHWWALARKPRALRGFPVANAALGLALALIVIGWADQLLDDYYELSVFCLDGGERISALDVDYACEAANYARDTALPSGVLLLLLFSFILRLRGYGFLQAPSG